MHYSNSGHGTVFEGSQKCVFTPTGKEKPVQPLCFKWSDVLLLFFNIMSSIYLETENTGFIWNCICNTQYSYGEKRTYFTDKKIKAHTS